MRLNDDKIIASINQVIQSGHPDPVGFATRAEVKTGFDFDKTFKGAIGPYGVSKAQAMSAGYTELDLEDTNLNLQAAIEIDMANYRNANDDIDEMFRLSNSGNRRSTESFVKNLNKKKEKLQKQLRMENGLVVALSPAPDTQKVKGKVIASKNKNIDDIEDIKQSIIPTEKIDQVMEKLIRSIVDEVSI